MSPPQRIALIQLVSEQTMQNLLPILRLRPTRVVHLATPRTVVRSASTIQAARQSGIETENPHPPLLSRMPSMGETYGAVSSVLEECRRDGFLPVVNFTGGTKLMSIGAFTAALNSKTTSLYVDTDDEIFVDGGSGETRLATLLEEDLSFTSLRRKLTVNVIAVANGAERVTSGRDWRSYKPLSDYFLSNSQDEASCNAAIHGPTGLTPNGREPRDINGWLQLLDRPFKIPDRVTELAVQVGLVRRDATGACLLPDSSRGELEALGNPAVYIQDLHARRFRAIQPLQSTLAFLTGAWWEIAVIAAAEQAGYFRDLRWSAQVGQRDGADLEEDILAVDGVRAVCISCKRGGQKARLLSTLEELDARGRRIGGHFARRFLAVYLPPQGKVRDNLVQQARKLGVQLILGPGALSGATAFRIPS